METEYDGCRRGWGRGRRGSAPPSHSISLGWVAERYTAVGLRAGVRCGLCEGFVYFYPPVHRPTSTQQTARNEEQ